MGVVGSVFSFVTGAAVDVFYRRRLLGGDVPKSGPVLLVANHPNALLDPIVVLNAVLANAGRRPRLLAKAPLFEMPLVSTLVKGMDSLPVYRAKDGADTKKNEATFHAVFEALRQGACVLIFPEGISHDEPQLQPLKTGAARMALGALERGAKDLVVVPVGLTYADKLRYRSTAAVEIGDAIAVKDFAGDDDAVHALTARIEEGLRSVTVNLERWEDLPLIEAIDAIWRQDDPERSRRLKNLAAGTAAYRAVDPAGYHDLRARLSDWLQRLARLGLRPADVAEGVMQARRDPLKLFTFLAGNFLAALFAFPLAIGGALFWGVPFWIIHAIYLLSGHRGDTGATIKVLVGLLLFPAWWAAAVAALAVFVDPAVAAAVAVAAPGAGLTTRHYFRRRFFAAQQLATFLNLSFRGRLVDDLVRERDAFCREFDVVATRVEAAAPAVGAAPASAV